jgi:hypothetical protein
MSNHGGSHMLNALLHGLVEIGVLSDLSEELKTSVNKLFRSACWQYDCNWGEIIDNELAVLLGTCRRCGGRSGEIDANNGNCIECTLRAQQVEILMGKVHLLRRLLQHRFGSLPRSVSRRLYIAPEEDLLHWSDNLADGTLSLEEISKPFPPENN